MVDIKLENIGLGLAGAGIAAKSIQLFNHKPIEPELKSEYQKLLGHYNKAQKYWADKWHMTPAKNEAGFILNQHFGGEFALTQMYIGQELQAGKMKPAVYDHIVSDTQKVLATLKTSVTEHPVYQSLRNVKLVNRAAITALIVGLGIWVYSKIQD